MADGWQEGNDEGNEGNNENEGAEGSEVAFFEPEP